MITLLSKLFIKDDMREDKKRSLLGVICGGTGIFLNICLFIGKLVAGLISNSVSIIADAINNLSDAGSSIVSLLGFKISAKKADAGHPYGHGRFEYVAGFIVSVVIMAMGLELLKESVLKIITPEETNFSTVTVIILCASILVKLYMAFYNSKIGKKINSVTVRATAIDSISDCGATVITLLSLLLGYYFDVHIDGIAGVIVSCFVFTAGIGAAREAIDPLLGMPPEPEFIDHINNIVTNFDKNILGLHDLMVHDYGPGRRVISLHAEVPADGNILSLHDVIDNLERKLKNELGCMVTIHMDPVVVSDPRVAELKAKVKEAVNDIHQDITIHDFRVIFGDTHNNLIFDAAVPFTCGLNDMEVLSEIDRAVKEKIGKQYDTVVDIDREGVINR